jgi:hypothetical protein
MTYIHQSRGRRVCKAIGVGPHKAVLPPGKGRIVMSNNNTLIEEPISADGQLPPRNSETAIASRESDALATTKDNQTAMIRTDSTAMVDASSDPNKPAVTAQMGTVERPTLSWFSGSSILSVAATSLLSAVLSLLSWHAQTNVQEKLDENSKYLSTQLSLTEDFYKKRLEAYEETYHNVALLTDALAQADVDVESKNKAMDGLVVLQKSYKKNKLYMSDNLYKGLADLWDDGTALPVLRGKPGSTDLSTIQSRIDSVEKYMKEDLHTEEMDQAIAFANAKRSN